MSNLKNPSKPIHAWTLDGTKVGTFQSGRIASGPLCISQGAISRAAREGRIIGGKYLLSYQDSFPGITDFIHKKSSPVWAWDIDGKPVGEYASQERAAKALDISSQSVRDSMRWHTSVKGGYIFTDSPAPPVLSEYRLIPYIKKEPKQKAVKSRKYILEELKWVGLGEFKDIGDASNAVGLRAKVIRRMILDGKVYNKTFRARMKGRKIFIEKQALMPIGEFGKLVDIANKINESAALVWQCVRSEGLIRKRYKVTPLETYCSDSRKSQ